MTKKTDIKKVCIYGPESTGKTTLARLLAKHFKTEWVPEMARAVLGDRHCEYEDIEVIAVTQSREIEKKTAKANKILFCDTDHITTQIYSEYYFNKVPVVVKKELEKIKYDLYLVLDIDVPWVADPQRDAGHKREYFKKKFKDELEKRNIDYVEISGGWKQRFEMAAEVINEKVLGG